MRRKLSKSEEELKEDAPLGGASKRSKSIKNLKTGLMKGIDSVGQVFKKVGTTVGSTFKSIKNELTGGSKSDGKDEKNETSTSNEPG